MELIRPRKYVAVNGCGLCDLGYTSVPCVICGGLGGRCTNPVCFNGEVAIACKCNPQPYEEATNEIF
jgi:hypothetical protein